MSKKLSAMGGGEFEFNPNKLEEKINRREIFLKENFQYLENELNKMASNYSKQGLGDFDNCKKELLRKLVLTLR